MQLGGIPGVSLLNGLFNPSNEPAATIDDQSYELPAAAQPAASPEALSQIAAQYDVTRLTPRDLSRMIEELRTAGALKPEDLKALTQLRASFDRAGLDPDEPLDVLDVLRQGVAAERASAAAHGSPEPTAGERQLAWMERLALVQRGGNLAELNAVA